MHKLSAFGAQKAAVMVIKIKLFKWIALSSFLLYPHIFVQNIASENINNSSVFSIEF